MLLMITYAALIGLFSVVYRYILAYEQILNWWFKIGMRYEKRWFYKPIWGCEMCIAGQAALWLYFFTSLGGILIEHGYNTAGKIIFYLFPWSMYVECGGNLFTGILFITSCIASSWLLYKGFKFLQK
jgi:hypothetical protein